MRNAVLFLSVFAYAILVFFAKGFLLCAFLAVNIAAMIYCKITVRQALKYIRSLLPFIIFVSIFNGALGFVEEALYLATRLILVCNITQCYRKISGAAGLASAIETLFAPLSIFKIQSRDIALMVNISLAFIPVLRRDFHQVKTALRAKGCKFSAKNAAFFLHPFFLNILRRTDEISKAIRIKGYVE